MPFSWNKKSRYNRFHQLVTDHLQLPKHGGSLVVETGFPTSLIDLYVRNRSRFRKSAVNKQKETDSPLSQSSADLDKLSSSVTDYRESDEIIEEDVVVANDREIDIEIENSSEMEVKKSVVMAKLNHIWVVLFMLVLALGTKRFTVGITVSAFALLIIDLVGKPLLLRRPSSIKPSESIDLKTENIKSLKENASVVVCREVMEIEEEVDAKQEVRSENGVDEVNGEVLMEVRHKSSRRAVMKSKMKKLVPKKLRKSSMGLKDDLSCEFRELKVMKRVQDVKPLVLSSERSDSKGETLSILKQKNEKIVSLSSKIDCSSNKDIGREPQQNSGYLVLCLIVLVGLIGGRVLALVLALSWCLILKRLQWRNGIEKKTSRLVGGEKAVVARHEVGHAIVGAAVSKIISGQPAVQKLSILPSSGGVLGFTYTTPTAEDKNLIFVDELRGNLVTLLGGRASEQVLYPGRVSTGAMDDICQATNMACKVIAEYGLHLTVGPISIATLSNAGMVQKMLHSALDVAIAVMCANPAVLKGLGARLEEKEKIEGDELREWLNLVISPKELADFVKGTQDEFR